MVAFVTDYSGDRFALFGDYDSFVVKMVDQLDELFLGLFGWYVFHDLSSCSGHCSRVWNRTMKKA